MNTTAMLRTDEIRRRRLALGLTMAEAARRAGFRTAQQWSGIENGWQPHIRAETLAMVALALECKMDDLYTLDEPTPKSRRKPRQN